MTAWQLARTDDRLELSGDLRMKDAAKLWQELEATARQPRMPERLDIDVSRVEDVDGNALALLVALREALFARGVACEIVGMHGRAAALVHLLHGDRPVVPIVLPPPLHPLERLGAATARLADEARIQVGLVGEIGASVARIARHPSAASWRQLPALIVRAGTDGLPIVMLLNFLVGFVMAYQSSEQLELYGAHIFVADVVGIAVSRELGPLITAIIICGRSGAAYAAEIGTMRVSEEIDALRTLGISPVPYLVIPRMVTLAIIGPILTLIGVVLGITGGLVVGVVSLDVTPTAFVIELRTAVVASDVWTGLVKSVFFGATIAYIGCQQGLTTRGAASGVGRGTTRTVVNCMFMIVVIDTIATVIFRVMDV